MALDRVVLPLESAGPCRLSDHRDVGNLKPCEFCEQVKLDKPDTVDRSSIVEMIA